MKRITFFLFAITLLLAAPALFTSCQEDAPEINYTLSVTVNNDFSEVIDAINKGNLKTEEAIKKLAEAIDKMNADQQTKLQAILEVLNNMDNTLTTKLVAIEGAINSQTLMLEKKLELLEKAIQDQIIKQEELAGNIIKAINAMNTNLESKLEEIKKAIESQTLSLSTKLGLLQKAIEDQTLSLGSKLDLLEKAINALPDYTAQLEAIKTAIANLPDYGDKLDAIKTAIGALPNYSNKFDAVISALNAMKAQIEALGTGQTAIVTEIGKVTASINNLIAEVKSGNTDAAEALAEIIKKLEELKAAIGSGGSGGSGGGSGGETPSSDEYVDLGLSVKWATKNLGASKPSDYGDYYAWGETEPKEVYNWATYKWMQTGQSDWMHITKYTFADGETAGIWYDADGTFIGDNKTTLEAADDAATAKLGSPWRMPTRDEIRELLDFCTWTWTMQDGKNGCKVKGTNGNAIFLPAAGYRYGPNGSGSSGYYWLGSLDSYDSNAARYLSFNSDRHDQNRFFSRDFGCSVRPVRP